MKKILRFSFVLSLIVLAGYGCKKTVDIDPPYALDADNFFQSPNDFERGLVGAYDLMQTSYLSLWIGEIASDNSIAGGESFSDTEGLHQIDAMTHGGINAELRSLWQFNYTGVTRCNYIFENQDNIGDFPGRSEILAQAHFLRGYYYSELVKFFGDVPLIINERIGSSELQELDRSPAAEVYAQIEQDLQAAADGLTYTPTEKGRVTRGAALALLGKVYLYQNKFTEAAQALETVINEGPYGLYQDYPTLFRVSAEASPESVFDIEYVGLEGGGYGCFVCLEGFVAPGFHGIRNYSGPIYGDGNSYNLPTQDLYDAFPEGDPRREVAILDIEAFIAANPGEEITYVVGAGGHTGYYNHKYIKRNDELGLPDTDLTSPVNHRVIRYADVLLMAAEALNRGGIDDGRALQYLTEVRGRVGLETPAVSGADLTEAIYQERRLELAGEGHRFFDLVRTGRAAEAIEGFQTGKHEVFPIPQIEIDLAGAGWNQNSGY